MARTLDLLRSQKTGVVACFATVALLGVGSVLADRLPEDYAGLQLDDLRFFFEPPRLLHLWFYALCAVLVVWAASALVCTWDGVLLRLRGRMRWTSWGTVLLHLGFPLALLGHLVGGLWATTQMHRVGADPVPIGGSTWRVAAVAEETHPDGSLRMLRATLEERPESPAPAAAGAPPGAPPDTVTIGYNQPLFRAWGAWELLLLRHLPQPGAVLRARDGATVALAPGERAVVGDRVVTLTGLYRDPARGLPVAALAVEFPAPARAFVPLGGTTPDGALAFLEPRGTPQLLLMERRNPSLPLVLAVALLALVGVVLAGADRLRRRRQA